MSADFPPAGPAWGNTGVPSRPGRASVAPMTSMTRTALDATQARMPDAAFPDTPRANR